MKTDCLKSLLCGVIALTGTAAFAQTYGVNIATTSNPTQTILTDRLFMDPLLGNVAGNRAPIGARLWFVADTGGDGVGFAGGGVAPGLFLDANDQIVFTDSVDGTLLGDQPGRYQRNGNFFDLGFAEDNIFAILWGGGAPNNAGEIGFGMTYDYFQIGVVPKPPTGNANWRISEDMFAGQFTVVPEPSAAIYVGLGLAGLAVARLRKSRKSVN